MTKRKKLAIFIIGFAIIYFIPLQSADLQEAIIEGFHMLQYYARNHVLYSLIPAFFVAGAIANFMSKQAVIKYFGAEAKKWVSYSVASVSGAILSVCSCTVLPLFAGIYKRGAGIGPATSFLYSGPAINVLAIILTARVLGWQLGLARIVFAIIFALIIGLLMGLIFGRGEKAESESAPAARRAAVSGDDDGERTTGQNLLYFLVMILILVFAAWAEPSETVGFGQFIYEIKWPITFGLLVALAVILVKWFKKDELTSWVDESWSFTEQILPLLFGGILIAGILMGRPGTEAGLIPQEWITRFVGANDLSSSLFASVIAAFMYFATLTEIPILEGLMGLGMAEGPALSLLLAGPALSLPNMLVIHSVLGLKKTTVFIVLVVIMSTLAGIFYGNIII
ncbi:MAG: permease [Bacillota bacterium]